MKVLSTSAEETERLGEDLAARLRAGDTVALFGGLGAGKTAFVRGLARGLGYPGRVTSPTFAIVNEYLPPRGASGLPLFHFDMYRLRNAEELYGIGWEDYLDRNGICVTEWSERIEEALPEDAVRVRIQRLSDTDRSVSIEGML